MSEKELNALESSLRGLTPSAQPLNRDAVMYDVGRKSSARRAAQWQIATTVCAFLALGFGAALASRPTEVRTVEHVVHVRAPATEPAPVPPAEQPAQTEPLPVAAESVLS